MPTPGLEDGRLPPTTTGVFFVFCLIPDGRCFRIRCLLSSVSFAFGFFHVDGKAKGCV